MKIAILGVKISNAVLVIILALLIYVSCYPVVIKRTIRISAYIPEHLQPMIVWAPGDEGHFLLKSYQPMIALHKVLRPGDWEIKDSDWEYTFF